MVDPHEASRRIWQLMSNVADPPPIQVRAWDGSAWGRPGAPTTVSLTHPGALRAMLWPPGDLTAGEAFVFGDYDMGGDLYPLLHWAIEVGESLSFLDRLRVLRLIRALPDERTAADERSKRPNMAGRLHSPGRDRQAIRYHYDVGNDFFALFLDPAMVYSCAHFLDPDEALEVAQRRKLDLVCRKLQLRRGERFLDVGCGWGALVVHAAVEYGVHGTGITLSSQQAEAARRLAVEQGVEDRVEIFEQDYRQVVGTYDAIASVGMVEHVGHARLPEYFASLRRVLAPSGRLLNHGIVTRDRNSSVRRPSFVRTYVFPDGDLRPLEEWIPLAEQQGLEVRDVEALRASYALTLRHWVANLQRNRAEAIRLVGERTYRIWLLYMAGSAVAFERGAIGVYQMLLTDVERPWQFGRAALLAADDRSHRIPDPLGVPAPSEIGPRG